MTSVNIDFVCPCGSESSVLTRSTDGETNFRIECPGCANAYAVTITQLAGPAEA